MDMVATARAEIKPLIKLGIPLMIGLAASLLIGVIDTVMIAPLGTVPLAAAGITTAILIVLLSALWGVVTALTVRFSEAHGAGDTARVSDEVRTGLATSLLASAIATLLMLGIFPLLDLMGQPAEVIAILWPYWASMAVWLIPFALFFGIKSLFDAIDR